MKSTLTRSHEYCKITSTRWHPETFGYWWLHTHADAASNFTSFFCAFPFFRFPVVATLRSCQRDEVYVIKTSRRLSDVTDTVPRTLSFAPLQRVKVTQSSADVRSSDAVSDNRSHIWPTAHVARRQTPCRPTKAYILLTQVWLKAKPFTGLICRQLTLHKQIKRFTYIKLNAKIFTFHADIVSTVFMKSVFSDLKAQLIFTANWHCSFSPKFYNLCRSMMQLRFFRVDSWEILNYRWQHTESI
jgi:hypothetical protein